MEAVAIGLQTEEASVGTVIDSQKVVELVTANAPAPGANIMIGGQSVADMMAQAQGGAPASDPSEQLSKLADLHDRGVLSDDEFAAQKAKILGA